MANYWVARRLFRDWTGVTLHPDLLAALWRNLSAEDRQFWLDEAEKPPEERRWKCG